MKCYICPRKCGTDRSETYGFCGCTDKISIRRAAPHFWEEPSVSGTKGSGTIFFEGCQLHCIYCQNHEISKGKNADSPKSSFSANDSDKLIQKEKNSIKNIFYSLEKLCVHNINLVTPDAYIPQLLPIIREIKNENFKLPFIMNCSGYETEEMINSLKGAIDIFLPDFKYMSPLLSQKYSFAKDYPEVAKKAIHSMVNQQPECIFDENGILQKGIIIRHMMIPGNLHDSKKVLSYLYGEYSNSVYYSLMSQYTPALKHKYEELNRKVTTEEYEELVDFAFSLGIRNCYIQETEAANESFIPDFSDNSII